MNLLFIIPFMHASITLFALVSKEDTARTAHAKALRLYLATVPWRMGIEPQ